MNRELPAGVRSYFGCGNAIPVGSGTVGLAVVLRALQAEGKPVLIPALACPNVAVSVVAAGATPRLVDVSAATYDFSIEALERAVDERVAAIVAIDAFGMPSDIRAIEAIARNAGCAVIEDACQAYGGVVDGVALGSRGHAGLISFGYAKPLELGGGGVVLTDDDELAHEMRHITGERTYRRRARRKNRSALKLMMKADYRAMIELDGKKGLLEYGFPAPQLRRLRGRFPQWVENVGSVRGNIDRIRALVNALPSVTPFDVEYSGLLPWRYSVKIADASARRSLEERMAAHGVFSTRLYRPVTDFLDVEIAGDIPVAREVAEQTVNIAYRTTVEDTRRVAEQLERLVAEAG